MTRPILCFGEALIDMHTERLDGRGFAQQLRPFAGGAPANTAVAVARLGGHARFAGMLSHDRFGDFLLDSLEQAGVDTVDVVRTDAAHTALALVTLDARGERSFSFYRPPSADLLFRAAHFRAEAFEGTAVFHACSNSLTDPELAAATLEGMRRARSAGTLVCFDLNLRPALWPRDAEPRVTAWPALQLADVVKLSAEEFAWLADGDERAALERLWSGCTRLLLVTDAERPVRWFHPHAQGSMPSYRVEAVDSTGAGDAFVGGLLHQFAIHGIGPADLDGWVGIPAWLQEILRYASACGALAVTRQGSFAAMPDAADVARFLETHP